MRNADIPAMPLDNANMIDSGLSGLTKREHFAAIINVDSGELVFNEKVLLEQFIGRNVDEDSAEDMIRASCEVEARFRVMKADALLAELEKPDA